jgi:hypothetical protein
VVLRSARPVTRIRELDEFDLGVLYLCPSQNYPGSKAALYPSKSSNTAIFLQALICFIPGVICEVMPPRLPGFTVQDVGGETFGRTSSARDDDDEQDVLEWSKGAALSDDYLEELDHQEKTMRDFWRDLTSGRWYEFFNVPKVKFVGHLSSHCTYVGLVLYMGQSNKGLTYDGQLSTDVEGLEIVVWIWTCAVLYAELRQLNSYDFEGFRMYIRSPWNKMDLWNCCTILTVMAFRLHCWRESPEDGTCEDLQSWSRCLYALTEFTLVLRTLNYLMVYESLGVLVIILIEMLANDVSLFLVLALIVSLGTGFSFKLLMPGLERIVDSRTEFANLPLFMSVLLRSSPSPACAHSFAPCQLTLPLLLAVPSGVCWAWATFMRLRRLATSPPRILSCQPFSSSTWFWPLSC